LIGFGFLAENGLDPTLKTAGFKCLAQDCRVTRRGIGQLKVFVRRRDVGVDLGAALLERV
jgi:hypothetical protein